MTSVKHMKWWGWGNEGVGFHYEDKPGFAPFVLQAVGLDLLTAKRAGEPSFDDLNVADSKASPEFIASDARKAALCKSSNLRFKIENETVSRRRVFKSNVNMVVEKVFTGSGRPERFARFNCPSPSLYCVLRPYA